MSKQYVWVMKGCPASGKSTYAKEHLVDELGAKRINNDDLRACFDNGKWSKKNEEIVRWTTHTLLKKFLEEGNNVVIDNVHVGKTHFDAYLKVIKSLNIDCFIEEIPMYVELDEAIRRDAARPSPVGEKVVRDFWKKLGGVSFQHYEPRQFFCSRIEAEEVVTDPNLPQCIIVDVDGTVADCTGIRSPYDGENLHLDRPIVPVIDVVCELAARRYKIVVVSGREDKWAEKTRKWLWDNGIFFDALFMRKSGDMRGDDIIKREILVNDILPRWNPIGVFDDRPRVIRMWRAAGLTCFALNDVEF